MKELAEVDDYWHEASRHKDWRESWYFNWVDLDSGICGFSTVALLPNLPKREFVIAIFIDGLPKLYLTEPAEPIPKDFEAAMSDGTLHYNLHQPFTEWVIDFQGRQFQAKIRWHQRFPAYDFGPGSGVTWGRHFEQSGKVTGTITLTDGKTHHFRGFGQRDKSWGVRDWHIDEWFALHAQFDELMIGLRHDTTKGVSHLSGCVSSKNGNVPLTEIHVSTKFETKTIRKPIEAETYLMDQSGRSYNLKTRLIHPLSFARYTRQFGGGETELFEEMVIHECEELNETGTGLAEWLFTHPG